MSKLLRGDFIRLFKSKIFWLGFIVMAGLASWVNLVKWMDLMDDPDFYDPPDEVLLAGAAYIWIIIAAVIGVFLGSDYSHGTIRNKHIMGHSRVAMYLSNLIVSVTATEIIHIAYMALIIGASAVGITQKFEMSAGNIAILIFKSILAVASLTSIVVLICMLISSRTACSVSAIVISFVLITAANSIYFRLHEKEYTEPYDYTFTNEYGEEIEIHEGSVKNPRYLTGTKRKTYLFFNDLLPNNQIMQLAYDYDDEDSNHTASLPLYSLSLIAVTTSAGILLFRRKDLK